MSDTSKDKSFWSMVIMPKQKYKFTVGRPLHISKAAVDYASMPPYSSVYGDRTTPTLMSLLVDCGDQRGITLCNLCMCDLKPSSPEADLDLYFKAGETITLYSAKTPGSTFSRHANANIHLSGYQM